MKEKTKGAWGCRQYNTRQISWEMYIQKQQKHSNNKNHKNIFTINLDPKSSDRLFYFYFLKSNIN